jgi:predicted transcriptional regulator
MKQFIKKGFIFAFLLVLIYACQNNSSEELFNESATNRFNKKIVELKHRLVFVISGEMSRQELMDKLELKHVPNFRKSYLTPALNDGIIEMTLPDKLQSKSQKYRLTSKGKKLKLKLENLNFRSTSHGL